MPPKKKRSKTIVCKKCDTTINPVETPPSKTWQLVSPMPDKEGRVTLTIMGSFRCPTCGASIKASLKKIKGDEIGSGMSKKETLLQAVSLIREPTSIDQIEIKGVSSTSVEKAIQTLIKTGSLSGRIEENIFYPE
ncbi:MAG: hypothetical protein ACFFFG_15325 [Candidatus Thorarchaeota archaeon]